MRPSLDRSSTRFTVIAIGMLILGAIGFVGNQPLLFLIGAVGFLGFGLAGYVSAINPLARAEYELPRRMQQVLKVTRPDFEKQPYEIQDAIIAGLRTHVTEIETLVLKLAEWSNPKATLKELPNPDRQIEAALRLMQATVDLRRARAKLRDAEDWRAVHDSRS